MIVTIDGPAGAGKSSIAKALAAKLGLEFLDTGAMYRAITLGVIRSHLEWDDVDGLIDFAKRSELAWKHGKVLLEGQDVSKEIRTPVVTAAIHYIADQPDIRSLLSQQQRRIAAEIVTEGGGIVTDGRDQGSEVFPDATCKIFLTASPQERAKRRQEQLSKSGRFLPIDEILRTQDQRDAEDCSRPVGALRPAEDSVVIDSDGMSHEEVLQAVVDVVHQATETA